MLKHISALFFFLIFILSISSISKADVTGSFNLNIDLIPVGTQTEAVKFYIDFQSNLVTNITLSGMTLGADIGFGVTGLEFAILTLFVDFGAMVFEDQFVFAPPFGCGLVGPGLSNSNGALVDEDDDLTSECPGNEVFRVGDGNADGLVDNAVGFVKKRIELEMNIAGLVLHNLAIFEDVDFPDISGFSSHEHDHIGPGGGATNPSLYFVGRVNNTVNDQTPTFGFGDVITISGETVSGIMVTGTTAICASGISSIKKKVWEYEVNEACTTQFTQGNVTPLMFDRETLSLENITFAGVTVNINTIFLPLKPISATITASFSAFGFADVTVSLSTDDITSISIGTIVTSILSENISLTLIDVFGDLKIDAATAVFFTVLNAAQSPASLVGTITLGTQGITSASVSLGVNRGPLSLNTATSFTGSGSLSWSATSFRLSIVTNAGIVLGVRLRFSPSGIADTNFTLGVVF